MGHKTWQSYTGAFLGFADGGGGGNEARRAETRGPKGRERGWGSWGGGGEGSQPPPHQLGGLGERCKLPQRGPGLRPGRQTVLLHFKYSGWPLLTPFLRFFDGDGGGGSDGWLIDCQVLSERAEPVGKALPFTLALVIAPLQNVRMSDKIKNTYLLVTIHLIWVTACSK